MPPSRLDRQENSPELTTAGVGEDPALHESPNYRKGFLTGLLLGLLLGLIVTGSSLLLVRRPSPPAIVLHPPPTPAPTATPNPTPTPAPITVFVSGAVVAPGLYTLPAQARAGTALSLAGGLLPEADPALVNQAAPLWDGAQIHVPFPNPGGPEHPPAGVSGSTLSASETGVSAGARPVDANTASAAELETLPGIGPAKAAAIIANRPYASVADLLQVPGIGPKTLEQLGDLITVSSPR